MGVNARGAGFSWLGEALMQLAAQNRDKKARDQYLAQQDERYNDERDFRERQFSFSKSEADRAAERASLARIAAANEGARNREFEFREKGGIMGALPSRLGGASVPMGYDPKRSLAYKQNEANLQLSQKYQKPERPSPAQLVPTESGYAVFDPNTRSLTPMDSGLRPPPKATLTKSDPLAAGFARRMQESNRIIGTLNENVARPSGFTQAAGSVPLLGRRLETGAMSGAQQQYRNAAENWIRANLRKESGAAIGKDEMVGEFRTYFPQPGEGPDVVAQKARLRELATQNMEQAAGGALGPNANRIDPDAIVEQLRQAGLIQ